MNTTAIQETITMASRAGMDSPFFLSRSRICWARGLKIKPIYDIRKASHIENSYTQHAF
jgi:hypothetical protein